MNDSMRHITDMIAIAWLAVSSYLSTIGAGLVSFPNSSLLWLASPLLLVPPIAWLGWSLYQYEHPGPARITTKSVAFCLGLIVLIIQFPAVAHALSTFF